MCHPEMAELKAVYLYSHTGHIDPSINIVDNINIINYINGWHGIIMHGKKAEKIWNDALTTFYNKFNNENKEIHTLFSLDIDASEIFKYDDIRMQYLVYISNFLNQFKNE